jgi:hypothetical protein
MAHSLPPLVQEIVDQFKADFAAAARVHERDMPALCVNAALQVAERHNPSMTKPEVMRWLARARLDLLAAAAAAAPSKDVAFAKLLGAAIRSDLAPSN